jgi:hypothetical protein
VSTEKDLEDDATMEKICESIDWNGFIKLLNAEFKRGFDYGFQAGKSNHAVASQAEYQRGYDAARADIFKAAETMRAQMFPAKKPITSDIQEVKTDKAKVPAEPEPDPPKSAFEPGTVITDDNGYKGRVDEEGVIRSESTTEPEKLTGEAPKAKEQVSLGGRPRANDDRPIHCPTNLEMAVLALKELKEPSSAPAILMFVRNRWWGECPDAWKSNLIEFAKRGKLRKDGLNYLLPLTAQEKIDASRKVLPTEPVRIPMPAVRPTEGPRREVVTPGAKLGPPARGNNSSAFQHGDKSVLLHTREFLIAQRLRAAMGKGHLDAKFLGDAVGIRLDAEATLRDLVSIMNPKIAELGLSIEFFKNFGFIMKEVA